MMSYKEQFERRMAGLPPPCVEIGQTPLTLTVHLAAGETWVFPWARFGHARLHGEELTVVFADHEIILRGQNLTRVAKDLTGLSVEILRTMAGQYRPLAPVTEPFIVEIKIRSESQGP